MEYVAGEVSSSSIRTPGLATSNISYSEEMWWRRDLDKGASGYGGVRTLYSLRTGYRLQTCPVKSRLGRRGNVLAGLPFVRSGLVPSGGFQFRHLADVFPGGLGLGGFARISFLVFFFFFGRN